MRDRVDEAVAAANQESDGVAAGDNVGGSKRDEADGVRAGRTRAAREGAGKRGAGKLADDAGRLRGRKAGARGGNGKLQEPRAKLHRNLKSQSSSGGKNWKTFERGLALTPT